MSEEEDPNAAICSVTGKRCRCGSGSGCSSRRWRSPVDPLPDEAVRTLKTVRVYAQACKDHLDELNIHDFQRSHPGPEVREIRRKFVTAQAMIDEILGELA